MNNMTKYQDSLTASTSREPVQLEPRVAKLEVGLDRLTDDVRDLANVVRAQGSQMEGEIQKLVVAVTQAAGPRKTDWSVIISALLLVMAVGSAVFWPLNQTSENNNTDIKTMSEKFDDHQKLTLHPVGSALIQRLEDRLQTHIADNVIDIEKLDKKLQAEYMLINSKLEIQLHALDNKVQIEMRLLTAAIDARVEVLTRYFNRQDELDQLELRQWRNKASGLIPAPGTNILSPSVLREER